jgi:putative ABC transport system permease protein
MLSSRWYKVLNDLSGNKMRTVLIVLSIAVGLFAVGTIVSSRTILATEMAKGYAAINPSSGTVRTVEPFDEDFVRSVRAMEDVEDADARRALDVRIQIGPGEWTNLKIFVIEDYDDMRVNKIWPESGAWPPPEHEMLIERAALQVIKAQVGDVVLIETPDERQRDSTIHRMAIFRSIRSNGLASPTVSTSCILLPRTGMTKSLLNRSQTRSRTRPRRMVSRSP